MFVNDFDQVLFTLLVSGCFIVQVYLTSQIV